MQRYFAKSKNNNQLILNDNDLYHINTVMRMKPNDKMEIVFNHQLFLCSLNNSKDGANIIEELEHINTKMPQVTLIIPLLKEQKMDLILQKATELGVSKFIPVIMERSIVKIDDKKVIKKLERWQSICKEASEQSKRIDIPVIENIKTINDLKNLEGLNIICSTSKNINNLKYCLKNNMGYDKINIVIGPEGGIAPKEEEKLISFGFNPISLGNRIMRVETVPMVILSIINYEYME
ncbi:MAG: RsmE family RNA methyltransferase [Bacilli bacterium]